MYKAIGKTIRCKPKEAVLVETDSGVTANEEIENEKITDFFQKLFNLENQTEIPEIQPKEMTVPFTKDEVGEVVKKS